MAIVNYENLPSENTPLTGGTTGNLMIMQENGTTHGTDTKLSYSQSFLNDHIVNVSNEVDEDYRVNVVMPSKFDTSQTPVAYYNATKSIIDNGIRITITTANTNLWCAFKLSNNLLGKQIYVSTTMTPSASNTGQISIFYGTDAEPYKQSASISLKQSGNISGTLLSTLPANCTGVYALIYGNGSSSNVQVGNYVDYTNLIIGEGTPSIVVDNDEIYNKDNMEQYSTGEIRIGTWINGKPLYRKTFATTNIQTTNNTIASITDLNINIPVKVYGLLRTSIGNSYPMPLTDSANNYSVLFFTATTLRGRAVIGDGGTISSAYITIEYTKTTD